MIVTETVTINGKEFVKTYSDEKRYIVQDGTGILYTEAIDPASADRTYTEGEVMESETEFASEIEEKAAAYDILMGVSE